jgi:putative membrane protein
MSRTIRYYLFSAIAKWNSFNHADLPFAFTTEAKDTKDVKFRAAVINGKTVVAAHKNMAYDLEKKL